MGGVVYQHTGVVPYITEYLDIESEKFYDYAGGENLRLLQTGKISTADFWAEFSRASGREITEDLWQKFFNPSELTLTSEIILDLKEKNRVIAGTNTIETHYQFHSRRGDYNIFDRVYASHKMGLAKPDPQFFVFILTQENSKPEDTIFIDDSEKNVETARELGINALHFTGSAGLRDDLKNLNLIS